MDSWYFIVHSSSSSAELPLVSIAIFDRHAGTILDVDDAACAATLG